MHFLMGTLLWNIMVQKASTEHVLLPAAGLSISSFVFFVGQQLARACIPLCLCSRTISQNWTQGSGFSAQLAAKASPAFISSINEELLIQIVYQLSFTLS